MQHIAGAEFHRIETQGFGQTVHLHFGGKMPLRPTKSTEGAGWHMVGVDGARIHGDVGDVVGAEAHQRDIAEHFGAGVSVRAAVAGHIHAGRQQAAVAVGAPTRLDDHGVALVMPDERFFPAPNDLNWPPNAALVQAPGCQGQDNLHRHIFTPTKRAADGWINDPNLVERQAQRVGNLFAIFMHPLAGHVHGDHARFIYQRNAGFWLQIGVLLRMGGISLFDHHIGCRERAGNVAAPDVVAVNDITAPFGVNALAIGLHGAQRICHNRQVFIINLNKRECGRRLRGRFGHYQGHLVAHEADDVAAWLGVDLIERPAQHRLVGNNQAVGVVRYVARGEHRDDAGRRRRGLGVQGANVRMRPPSKENFHPQLIGQVYVAWIARGAGDFRPGVNPRLAAANSTHGCSSSGGQGLFSSLCRATNAENRLDDFGVACAAAQVAGQGLLNGGAIRGRIFGQ